jgi:hypothetical protein
MAKRLNIYTMTLEQALKEIEVLNAVYHSGTISREVYLKKHKAISNKHKKANRPMSYNERIRAEGIKIKRNARGWYTFIGKNFSVELSEESCESTWWEVNIWSDNVDKRVFEFYEGYNHFYTKSEVVSSLYELDKRLTDEA